MSKSHHSQSIRKNFVYLLIFGHIQILGTLCSYKVIQTYESKVSIMQLYNLAKFSKRKNKYKIQFIKNEFPFHNLFWQVSTYDLPPKMTKTSTPSKMFWEPKSPPIVQGGEDTTTDNKALCTRC